MHACGHKPAKWSICTRTPSMRNGHENDPFHVRFRREVEHAAQLGKLLRVRRNLGNWDRKCRIPERIATVCDQCAREQTAHAMPNDNHVLRCKVATVGIDQPAHFVKVVPEVSCAGEKRKPGRIEVVPDLVAPADFGIAHQLVGQLLPCERRGSQTMHHNDWNPIRCIRLHEV